LNCIAAQRLVRVLCPQCRKAAVPGKAELAFNRIESNFFPEPIYKANGCEECSGLGYSGRTAIAEILELTDEIKEMILAKKPTSEIKKTAMEQGMLPIRRNGLERVKAGVTSLDELNRVTVKEWV
jgi:type II secretory ATPase GspE/PulE/Tfp pilus assembly ATPase PilB-like protein